MTYKYNEKTLSSKVIFEGRAVTLLFKEVELPDGRVGTREVIKHPGACTVLAITQEDKILFVEQYRKACELPLIEIPAGRLEPGEDPLTAAVRELEEETGYVAGKITKVSQFYTAPGFCDELMHVYLAEDLTKLEVSADLDEDEFLDLMEFSLDEALEMINNGRIIDAKTIIAIQYLALRKKE